MGMREAATRIGRALAAAAALALLGGAAGCGSDDYANEPRPASPVLLGARIDSEKVQVSPHEVGAGIMSFTISNQSSEPAALTIVSEPSSTEPTLRRKQSGTIEPGDLGSMQVELPPGHYEVGAGDFPAEPVQLTVGRERQSSKNDLLLP